MDALDEKWTQCLVGTSSGKFNTELNPYTTDKPADTWHALVGSDNRPMCIPDVLRIDAGAVREGNWHSKCAEAFRGGVVSGFVVLICFV